VPDLSAPTFSLVPDLDHLAKPHSGVSLPDPKTELRHGEVVWAVIFAAMDGRARSPGAPDPGSLQLQEAYRRLRQNFDGRFFPTGDPSKGWGAPIATRERERR
jgi:hypothetical protein